MSLVTRCTACGTVFRVVQDQLKVSEGWVRCGRCSEVFNALEGLFDLEREVPPGAPAIEKDEPALPPTSAEPVVRREPDAAPPANGAQHPFDAVDAVDADDAVDAADAADAADATDTQAMSPIDSGQHSTPAGRVSERDRLEFPDAQFDPDMLSEDAMRPRVPPQGLESASKARSPSDDAGSAPEFVRRAQRRARWRSPTMRAVHFCATVALIGVLALQGMHHHRNLIAARWPASLPMLSTWCGALACRIDAPSRIDEVSVETTSLTQGNMPDAFKFSVVLRNRGAIPVALPSVDLALTDGTGKLIARRVLAPRDFRAAAASIGPGGESALQLVLAATGARVTGYTVEVFYP